MGKTKVRIVVDSTGEIHLGEQTRTFLGEDCETQCGTHISYRSIRNETTDISSPETVTKSQFPSRYDDNWCLDCLTVYYNKYRTISIPDIFREVY